MQTPALKLETNYLLVSASGNLLVGCVGVAAAALSSSQAILLDGLFNITYFATGLFTIKVASLVARGDDERFPNGYAFFEPLVNGIKGTLVLVHVVLPTDYRPDALSSFDALRTEMQQALSKAHVATIVDVLFTADRQWGAPLSDGGAGGPTNVDSRPAAQGADSNTNHGQPPHEDV